MGRGTECRAAALAGRIVSGGQARLNGGGSMRSLTSVLLVTMMECGAQTPQTLVADTSKASPSRHPQQNAAPPTEEASNQAINNRYVKEWSERITGRENEPAARVFKNIQLEWFKDVPASLLLRVMSDGYARALGVTCTHCHTEENFASDHKRPKRAAREMAVMHRMINEQLGRMQSLKTRPQDRAINCSMCHRGTIDPIAPDR
jgi:hypothetical protein